MGTLFGHVAPGSAFLLYGLWQLLNHIRLHALHPTTYSPPVWFPHPKYRYLEPCFTIVGSIINILFELFIDPRHHQPLDTDGTIPSSHLHNFEHASISLGLVVSGAFLIIIDKTSPKTPRSMIYLVASLGFAQEFLLFHLHSTDHTGPEGQYHFFLQLIILVSLATTLLGIPFPDCFLVGFVRALSIFFQGVWFIALGIMLWTPSLLPKGCFLNNEDGRQVARCRGDDSLSRAKSLINLEFSWYFTLVTIFGMSLYLVLDKIYGYQRVEYSSLALREVNEDSDDIESQKKLMMGNSKV